MEKIGIFTINFGQNCEILTEKMQNWLKKNENFLGFDDILCQQNGLQPPPPPPVSICQHGPRPPPPPCHDDIIYERSLNSLLRLVFE